MATDLENATECDFFTLDSKGKISVQYFTAQILSGIMMEVLRDSQEARRLLIQKLKNPTEWDETSVIEVPSAEGAKNLFGIELNDMLVLSKHADGYESVRLVHREALRKFGIVAVSQDTNAGSSALCSMSEDMENGVPLESVPETGGDTKWWPYVAEVVGNRDLKREVL